MTDETKACVGCGQIKPLSAFPRSKGENRRKKCYTCTNAKTEKKCNECGEVKPLDAFSLRWPNSSRTGRLGVCDVCRALETDKKCPRCGFVKPKTDFYVRNVATGKLHAKCKKCMDDDSRAYAAANPEKVKEYDRTKSLRARYGLSRAEYDALLLQQGGKCALCRSSDPYRGENFFVDHDHDHPEPTSRDAIRGLLCYRCNSALARFRDNAEGILKLVAYLTPSRYPKIVTTSTLSSYPSGSREYYRNKQMLDLYGIGIAEYDQLYALQGGRCWTCERTDPGREGAEHFSVDHDHATKEVRGLLCYGCNSALGVLGDTAAALDSVLAYVQRNGQAGGCSE